MAARGRVGYRREPRLGGFRRPAPESPNVALRHASFRGYADYKAGDVLGEALAVLAADATGRSRPSCAETLWWRCHRRLIADAAVLLCEAAVWHTGHDGRLTPHRLARGVRRDAGGCMINHGG